MPGGARCPQRGGYAVAPAGPSPSVGTEQLQGRPAERLQRHGNATGQRQREQQRGYSIFFYSKADKLTKAPFPRMNGRANETTPHFRFGHYCGNATIRESMGGEKGKGDNVEFVI